MRDPATLMVSEAMSRNHPTIGANATILEAAAAMVRHRCPGLPVVDKENALVGYVAATDLMFRPEIGTAHISKWWDFLGSASHDLPARYIHEHGQYVRDVMTHAVTSVRETTRLNEAVGIMAEHRLRQTPVIGDDGKVSGCLSRLDLLSFLLREAAIKSEETDDAAMEDDIALRLRAERWAPRALVSVRVVDGVAHLLGTVTSLEQRKALTILAETTPGVKSVVDELLGIEPISGVTFPAAGESA